MVDGVLVVTINRPEARNAINTVTAEAIGAAMDRLDEDPALVAGVVTGAGGTFCAGMDLKAFLAGENPSIPVRGFAGIVERPPAKPLIAAVEGYALAGGFEIALACDMIVAAEDAKFGLPEVKRGLVAAGGGLMRLPERVPYHLAHGDGRSPASWCPPPRLRGRAGQPAHADGRRTRGRARARPRHRGQRAARRPRNQARHRGVPGVVGQEMFDKQREITLPVRASEDAREGATAFKEKRAPRWRAR